MIYYKVFSIFNIHDHCTIWISIFEEIHPHTKVNYPFNGQVEVIRDFHIIPPILF